MIRTTSPLARAVLTTLCLAVASAGARAAEQTLPTSRWGADDTLGAVHRMSPEKVVQAARLVRTGETYALGVVTGHDTPAYPPRQYAITILQPGDGTGATMGAEKATGNDDLLYTWNGIGSQIDGLGHMGVDHVYYNNNAAEDFVTARGLTKLATHEIPPIVTRGVLLDMTDRFDADPIPEGTAFSRGDVEAVARAQGVTLEAGDVVLFHTGWQALAATDQARFMAGQPGIGLEAARYLAEIGVVAVGADTWALEAIPHEDPTLVFPVHVELLARNGIYILENMNTAALAADEGWTFLFVLGQPRFEGAVQAVINPVAIR